MSTIVLSSSSYCHRHEIAKHLARALDADCLGTEIETTAAVTAGVEPDRVRQALHHSGSRLHLFSNSRERYLAYFQAALVSALGRGDVIYHGEVGHLFVPDVSHILKVQVKADLEDRAVRRSESENIDVARARELLLKEEAQRARWCRKVFHTDGSDPSLFDLVVDLSRHGIRGTCQLIEETAREKCYQPVTYSLKALSDHELACWVRARLIEEVKPISVSSRDGEVTVRSRSLSKGKRADAVRRRLLDMEGVNYVVFE